MQSSLNVDVVEIAKKWGLSYEQVNNSNVIKDTFAKIKNDPH